MDRQHIHEVAGHLVREAYLPAILSPPDKLRRVGKPTVNAVYLALQSFGGLFMLPPLPVYRLVQPPYLGVQAFVLLGKVIYLLLLPLDFRRADPRADTVEDGRTYLGGEFFSFSVLSSPFTAFSSASACSLAIRVFSASCFCLAIM